MSWNKYDIKTNPKWEWVKTELQPMTKEEREKFITSSMDRESRVTREDVEKELENLYKDEIWVNGYYQVNICKHDTPDGIPDMIHVSIKTHKKQPVRDWRDFQQIKNDLVGPECEAVELYPAESRLIDTANQYHLWAIASSGERFPWGWHAGRAVNSIESNRSKQRPINK
jgi:hypothetical protein